MEKVTAVLGYAILVLVLLSLVSLPALIVGCATGRSAPEERYSNF